VATSPGVAVGTPAYMSPEQLQGLPVDYRSDIFSFGLVLCEMFTGRHPFHRPTAVETMSAILTADPFATEDAAEELPRGVQPIAAHCLEKDPQHRFQAAHDLAFDLGLLAGSARNLTTGGPAEAPWLRRWWPWIRVAAEVCA
jgi:serine/threonine-protein kinase